MRRGHADPSSPAPAGGSYWFWPPIHPEKSAWPGPSRLAGAARRGAPAQCPAGLARRPGVSFFICQPHCLQNVMDGGQRTVQSQAGTQLLEGQIGLLVQQSPHLAPMGRQNPRLAPGETVARANLPGSPALLQKLFDHAQRNPVTAADLLSGPLLLIIGSQNSFAQVQR